MIDDPADQHRRSIDRTNTRLERTIGWVDRILPYSRVHPLDGIPSIKLRVSIVIGAAIAVTIITLATADALEIPLVWGVGVAVVAAIILVQLLSRGLTSPLRDMMQAAHNVADGDYSQRVEVSAEDETGELGRAFNSMTAHIEILERQRQELTANIGHELRTPIATIRGSIENLLDDVATDRIATLEVMLRQTDRLGRLVGQLMDLSRLEAGVALMRPVHMDLVEVTEHAVEEARLRTAAPLLLATPESLTIEGDPERLHQVVANLLDNAIRHSPSDEPINITILQDEGAALIRVEDRGPGIPHDELRSVFERFHTASAEPPAPPGGSGLGLAICRWIVDLHGGTITATNAPPQGCRIEVTLPAAKGAETLL